MSKIHLLASTLVVTISYGQSTGDLNKVGSDLNKLNFEVASVKKAAPPQFAGPGGRGMMIAFGRRGGPGTSDPGQITWSGATLKDLLAAAYEVKRYQVSGPAWLDSERYDIIAKVPAGTTKDQVKVMWQHLLADRFGVTLHRISKMFPVDELEPVKGGAKVKETTLDPKAAAGAPQDDAGPLPPPPLKGPPPGAVTAGEHGPGVQYPDGGQVGGAIVGGGPGGPPPKGAFPGAPELDKNGVPQLPRPGLVTMMTMSPSGPTAHMVGRAQTMEQLAEALGRQLNHPVVDKTGLTGKYDFVLEFTPDFNGGMPPGAIGFGPGPGPGTVAGGGDSNQAPKASDPAGATLVAALQKDLGLRLVATKAPLDVLVIDKAQKEPAEN
ncbi:MAG TPA: TIGR03435 family protein [Bryobacteraceae bacterium]|nr:TIGR03435 family protein [Bryobacteraceae bacterium]